MTVSIPANVDQPDKLLAGLTARQLAILSITGLLLYAGWSATHRFVPLLAFLIVAIPIGATAALLALGQRDGLSLDQLLIAAIRQRLQPSVRVAAPEGIRPAPAWLTNESSTQAHRAERASKISPAPLRLPAEGISDTGLIDLSADGVAVIAVASTVNFALRTPAEQEALVAAFGRFLHALAAPVQILVRAQQLDLSTPIAQLREAAGGLPHPALEAAALEHADYLAQLSRTTDLLRRQVLVVLREPVRPAGPISGLSGAPLTGLAARRRARQHTDAADYGSRRSAETRLVRRLAEAIDLLRPAGITLTPLTAGQATAVLATACNPDTLLPPSADVAGADEVITGVITTPAIAPLTDPEDTDGWDPRDDSRADDTGGDWDDTDTRIAARGGSWRGTPPDDFDDPADTYPDNTDPDNAYPDIGPGGRTHR